MASHLRTSEVTAEVFAPSVRWPTSSTKRPPGGGLSVALIGARSGYAKRRTSGPPTVRHEANTSEAEEQHSPGRGLGDGTNIVGEYGDAAIRANCVGVELTRRTIRNENFPRHGFKVSGPSEQAAEAISYAGRAALVPQVAARTKTRRPYRRPQYFAGD
jgi:hypothetical protein